MDPICEDISGCREIFQLAVKEYHSYTTYSAVFFTFCQHDNNFAPLLYYHSPEVRACIRQGPLGSDKLLFAALEMEVHQVIQCPEAV